jgi:hypothetical protein
MAENDLVAKTLREKCVNEEVRKRIDRIEDLNEMWNKIDTCYKRPEKYRSAAL